MRVRPNPHTIYLSYHFFPQYLHCVVLSASPHTKYTQADMSFFFTTTLLGHNVLMPCAGI